MYELILLLMSRSASINDPDDQSIISTTGNYLCVQSQNDTLTVRGGLERAKSFNSRINRSNDLKKQTSYDPNLAIKFFSLRKMIKGEKTEQISNYDPPSTFMLTSSLANSLSVGSTTNSFETTSSKSSSKSSFLKTFFNSTLLSSSSTSLIRSTNSTPTHSPLSKSNSSQSLISGQTTNMSASNLTSNEKNNIQTANLLQIPTTIDTDGHCEDGKSMEGEQKEEKNKKAIQTSQYMKVSKNRNRKTIDTLYACFRVRSSSISSDLESGLRSNQQVDTSISSISDKDRLIVSNNTERTLKQTVSLDRDDRLPIEESNSKKKLEDNLRIKNSKTSLLIEKTNKEDELMSTIDRTVYLKNDENTYKSADLIDSCAYDHVSDVDFVDGGFRGGDQWSCSEKNGEINSNKSDPTLAHHQSANRSVQRTSLMNISKICELHNLQLNKSKSSNNLDDSIIVRKLKPIRSSSENQLPDYEQSSEQSVPKSISLIVKPPVESNLTSVKSNSTKSTLASLLKTLITVKGLNRIKKDRFRESLNSQSANCIEQLLSHEQCKSNVNKSAANSTSIQSTATGLKNEIKMKLRRSDAEYNLTKSMKTVDHKDLTLMQILALKTLGSKLKLHQEKKLSETLLLQNSNSNKKLNQRLNSKLINKMVLPELSPSPVCAENAPSNDCFVDSNSIYNLKTDHHINFASKFITNDENSFACDENISKNEQNIYKQQFTGITELTKKKEFHQCDKQQQINDNTLVTSVNTNSNKNLARKWIQLAGHEQSFFNSSKPGIILKKNEQNELTAYKELNEMNDQIIEFIPKFYSVVKTDDGQFIELQDLLSRFDNKCNIIDLKMGTRTFLENDVTNSRARPDLYEKLIKIDSTAATQDEHRMKAITKLRYMTFREELSSSSTLGFRIEGFRCKCDGMIKDFKYLRKEDEVKKVLSIFMPMNKELRTQLLKRLKLLKARFKESNFFKTHEVVGSSLLIIHDDNKIGVWMIDFGRTVKLPEGVKISHENKWTMGNHEDGYLTGLNNLIRILKEIN